MGTETINVTDHAPDDSNQTDSVMEEQELGGELAGQDPDGDSITHIDASEPSNGTATVSPNAQLTYTPNNGFTGQDSFTFDVSDGIMASAVATVFINVVPRCRVAA